MNKCHQRQNRCSRRIFFSALVMTYLLAHVEIKAQLSSNMQTMMRRIDSGEFGGEARGGGGRRGARGSGQRRWIDDGRGYVATEGGDLVRYDTATGERQILMSAKELTPPGLERALPPGEASSTNTNRMLFATNPRSVMMRKTA